MIKAKRDFINALVIIALSIVLYVAISSISDTGTRRTGAAFFPNLIVPVLGGLGVVMLVGSIRRIATEQQEALVLDARALYRANRQVVLVFLLCAAYIPALHYLGYLLAAPLFIISVYLLLTARNTRRLWAVVLSYTVFTTFLYFVFQRYLYVLMPPGQLF